MHKFKTYANIDGTQYHEDELGNIFCEALPQDGMVGGTGDRSPSDLERVKLAAGRVLDYGCGQGHLVALLREHGFDAHGYDPYNPEFQAAPEGPFDTVFMVEVIEHTSDPYPELDAINEALVEGGKLIVESSFSNWVREGHPYLDPKIGHCSIFSHRGLSSLMEEKGFRAGEHVNRNVRVYHKYTGRWNVCDPDGLGASVRGLPLAMALAERDRLNRGENGPFYFLHPVPAAENYPHPGEDMTNVSPEAVLLIAERLARWYHRNQFRRDGVTPYIIHPEAVANSLYDEHPYVRAAGWLHDVIEDTKAEIGDLLAAGIPQQVLDLVLILTKGCGDTYEQYLAKVKQSPQATRIKLADMRHNMINLPPGRQLSKYENALAFLESGDATPCSDCIRCPRCDTDKLVITNQAGYRACWECGAELADDFPDEAVWEFRPNPYGWVRRSKPSANMTDGESVPTDKP